MQPVPLAVAVADVPAAEPPVQPTPIPAPVVVAPEQPPVQRVKVAFTNGSGVNLRAKAGERSQRLKTIAEGTVLEVVGTDETSDGLTWRNVRDANGTRGWVAGKFVAQVQP
jgi:SH3-like domain-containing protein